LVAVKVELLAPEMVVGLANVFEAARSQRCIVPVLPARVNWVELVGKQTFEEPDRDPATVIGETETRAAVDVIEVEQEGVDELGSTIQ
jgi:hypothetical protein